MPAATDITTELAELWGQLSPAEAEKVQALLGWTSRTKRFKPPEYHDSQNLFWESNHKFRAFVGGIGSGKSLAGVYEVLSQPPSTGTVVAPTFTMLRDATLRTFLEITREKGLLSKFNKQDMYAELVNGTVVLFRSADEPDRLRGPNLGWFYLDEAAMMDPEVWLIMIGRLREHPGRAWATSTPRGYNWLFEIFTQTEDPNYWFTTCSTRDNPFLPEGFVASLESQYDEYWSAQEIEGQFIAISSQSVFDAEYLRQLLPGLEDPKEIWKHGTNGLNGTFLLWEEPQRGVRYTIGADVAEGLKKTKTDESDAFIIRNDTWKQVGHYFGKPDPKSFAFDLYNLSEWFNSAELCVENNTVGLVVISYLEDLGARLWYNDQEDAKYLRTPDRDQRAGFRSMERSKSMADGELRSAIIDASHGRESIQFSSRKTVEQCIHYVYMPNGSRAGEGTWHDDSVRSAALAWFVAKDYGLKAREEIKGEFPMVYGNYWRARR